LGGCGSLKLDLKKILFKEKFCRIARRHGTQFFTHPTWPAPAETAKLSHPKEHPMHIRSLLALALMLTQAWAAAQTTDAPSGLTLDQARAQRDQAKTMKAQARKTYDTDVKACQSKAIAIGCVSSAKDRRAEIFKQADALELEGRTVERETLRREAEAKAAKREAEAPGREAKDQADAERFRENEARRATEREKRQAEEPAKLESRHDKVAAEKAARERKLEKQRKKDARQAEAAADRAREKAEKQEQQAERIKRIDERKRINAEQEKRRLAKQAAAESAAAARAGGERK